MSDPAIFSETHSLEFQEKVNSKTIQQALSFWVKEMGKWAKGNAYLIGHIKLFVDGQENLWLSSTGKGVHIKHSPGWSEWVADRVSLSLTAIIFGPSRQALAEVAHERLQECVKKTGCVVKMS